MSHHAPYAVVLDCVGGTDLIPYMDHLILDDPKAPQLGHYITIVGDSKSDSEICKSPLTQKQRQAETRWAVPSLT
jgi:hypothetical protein